MSKWDVRGTVIQCDTIDRARFLRRNEKQGCDIETTEAYRSQQTILYTEYILNE